MFGCVWTLQTPTGPNLRGQTRGPGEGCETSSRWRPISRQRRPSGSLSDSLLHGCPRANTLRLLTRGGPRLWRLQLKASEMVSTLAQPYRCIQAPNGVCSLKLALQFPRRAEKATNVQHCLKPTTSPTQSACRDQKNPPHRLAVQRTFKALLSGYEASISREPW